MCSNLPERIAKQLSARKEHILEWLKYAMRYGVLRNENKTDLVWVIYVESLQTENSETNTVSKIFTPDASWKIK